MCNQVILTLGEDTILEVIKNRPSIRTYLDKVRETLNLPENLTPYSLVPIGYSEEENVFIDKFDENKIHRNKFE